MQICMVTNHRNKMIFGDNLIVANQKLGNNTYIFELNYDASVESERLRLLGVIEKWGIDTVLFLNDFRFDDGSYFITHEITTQVDCRLWIWDTMYDLDTLGDHIRLYSKVFSFEYQDVVQLQQKCSIEANYMPLYAGPQFYDNPRKENDIQDMDIFFIGTIAGSKKRLSILEAVAKLAYEKGYKMVVLGRAWHSHHWHQRVIGKFKFRYKYPYLSKYIENKVLLPDDVIECYKRSKINLNIHIEGQTCFNCRTFEVIGNNNFLLSDNQNTCGMKLVPGIHFDVYSDTSEIITKIQYFLEHDAERNTIACSGGQLVQGEYNLVHSLKRILSKE